MLLSNAINGDYSGKVVIKIKALWAGPEADKFIQIEFLDQGKTYFPYQLKRVVQLENTQIKSMGKSLAKGIAGGILFGGIGAIAGAVSGGNKNLSHYGIEFSDRKKVIIENEPNDKSLQCLILYAKQQGIFEQNLGF